MKLPLIALCLLSFILIKAVEANYKKDYCGNQDYVLRSDKLPHLHCDFFTLSYAKEGGKKDNHVKIVGSKGAISGFSNSV